MRVCYLGNFQPDIAPAKRWSTETQVAATLEQMGHTVLRLQENAVEWDVITDVAGGCDLMLWTTTWNRDPAGALAALKELDRAGVPTVGFHLDLYFGIARAAKVVEDPFFRCSVVFTADGGHQAEFEKAGVNHRWLPPATYGPEAVAGERNDFYRCDIGFVGSYPYPHPEHAAARAEIIHLCQGTWRGRFRMWRGGVRGRDLSDLYASVKVVVGDSCLAGRAPRYWSDRIPETLGRRGFLIHPYVEGIEDHFTDGKHLRLFEAGDMFQLRELVGYYLEHPDERAKIAAAGQRHVRRHHTYEHRMTEVLRVARRTET